MDKFSVILEGWRNSLIPPKKLKETIAELSTYRLDICEPCKHNSTKGSIGITSYCKECSCPLIVKSKSFSASCPIGKWPSYTSDDERNKIEEKIKNSHNIDSE